MAGIDNFVASVQPACTQPAQQVVLHCLVAWVLKGGTGQVTEGRVGLLSPLEPSFLTPVPPLSAPAVQTDEDTDERYSRKKRRQEYLCERHVRLQLFEAHHAARNSAQDAHAQEPRDNPFRDPWDLYHVPKDDAHEQ